MRQRLAVALTFLFFSLTAIVPSSSAAAKDLEGRFGLGGQIGSLMVLEDQVIVPAGLSLRYWVGAVGFQGLIAFAEASTEHDSSAIVAGALRVLVNAVSTEHTNLFAGAGVRLVASESEDDPLGIDALVGVEHFFSDHFSVSGEVGLNITMFEELTLIELGNVASWGTAFHFYF